MFPDTFVVTERAPYYDPGSSPKGRLLSAGFHLMQGYYRDDGPLCEGDWEEDTCRVICPRHGSAFDLRTGRPMSLPAFEPVETYAVPVPVFQRLSRSGSAKLQATILIRKGPVQ